jgi:tRNA modification GTPase
MNHWDAEEIGQDTIAAIATPVGCSGIGIVRISGQRAVCIADALFSPMAACAARASESSVDRLPSHFLKHGYIRDPGNQRIVDEVLLVVMRHPHSYTCEDVVEIQSHSGPVVLNKLIKLVLAQGARLAEAGEFTRRAFLNGRIDLSQAEAVEEMISAKSEEALSFAADNLSGAVKEKIMSLIEVLGAHQAEIEAAHEFPDEVQGSLEWTQTIESIRERAVRPVEQMLMQYEENHLLWDGIRLGIAGTPNVGKSSLLNAMILKDKAIVTPIPGTTRDPIEAHMIIDGLPICITDTAGLRESQDLVEIIGIEKTLQQLGQSDIVLFVVDAERPFSDADLAAFEQLEKRQRIIVVNKIDRIAALQALPVPPPYNQHPVAYVSAKYGHGISGLKDTVVKYAIGKGGLEPGRGVVPNLRQKLILESVLDRLKRSCQGLEEGLGTELIVSDLARAKERLGEITGHSNRMDVMDEIFSRFCIGK